ncbi:hypothetical protein BaRGS_00026547 [Batillaria attramentaria]|uniref:Uncharacterized protein n=1 Tax=Batillaria attramentaria TaxID=370345 RepID=A0ABD0K5E9_9CAEN
MAEEDSLSMTSEIECDSQHKNKPLALLGNHTWTLIIQHSHVVHAQMDAVLLSHDGSAGLHDLHRFLSDEPQTVAFTTNLEA